MRVTLLLLIFLGSCSNQKEKIVNEEIKLKKEIDSLKFNLKGAQVEYQGMRTIKEAGQTLKELDPNYVISVTKESLDSSERAVWEIEYAIEEAHKKFDSLELELKKY